MRRLYIYFIILVLVFFFPLAQNPLNLDCDYHEKMYTPVYVYIYTCIYIYVYIHAYLYVYMPPRS